jgi:hypothetical protein
MLFLTEPKTHEPHTTDWGPTEAECGKGFQSGNKMRHLVLTSEGRVFVETRSTSGSTVGLGNLMTLIVTTMGNGSWQSARIVKTPRWEAIAVRRWEESLKPI